MIALAILFGVLAGVASESGASLRGAGFVVDAIVPAKSDEGWTNRKGRKKQRVVGEPKIRWAVTATGTQE